MRIAITLLATLSGLGALAAVESVKLLSVTDAVVHFCSHEEVSCTETIDIDGKRYSLSTGLAANVQLRELAANYAFQKQTQSRPGSAVGFLTAERLHGGAKVTVFKAIDLDMPFVR